MTAGGVLMKEGTTLKNKCARFSTDDFFYLRPWTYQSPQLAYEQNKPPHINTLADSTAPTQTPNHFIKSDLPAWDKKHFSLIVLATPNIKIRMDSLHPEVIFAKEIKLMYLSSF